MASVDGQHAVTDSASYQCMVEKRTVDGQYAKFEPSSTNPVIDTISPTPGTIVRTQAVSLRVTDPLGIASVVAIADYASGKSAVIHDGSTVQPGFTSGSSRTPTTGGFNLVLAEDDGWFDSFTLRTVAVNSSGGVAVTNAALAYVVSNPAIAVVPALSSIVPANAATITSSSSVRFQLTHALGKMGQAALWATHADGRVELVHDGSAFTTAYAGSARVGITNGFSFELVRTGGWPTATLTLTIAADDTRQGVTTLTLGYTVSNPPPPPDVVAPSISNVSPQVLSDLGRLDPVFFDVTDVGGLGRTILAARFADGTYEVVHDGAGFAAGYAALSTRVAITNGFRYRVRRTAGWPSLPGVTVPMTICVWTVDAAGNAS